MKIKLAVLCLIFVGAGTFGAILAAPQDDSRRKTSVAGRDPVPASGKTQPALHNMGSYVVEPPDLLIVEVLEALPGRPISGERLVRPDGKISLGFYGDIYVAGLTIPEVKEKVVLHLQKYLADETLGLEICDMDTGKVTKRIEPKDTDRVFVDVTAYNSKNYYVLGAVAEPGRLPVTGRETILDALSFSGGLNPDADHAKVMLYRQGPGGSLTKLPVNIDEITMGDDPSTNYQLEPGDRLVIPPLPGSESASNRAHVRPTPKTTRREGLPQWFDRQLDPTAAAQQDIPRQPRRAPAEQATRRPSVAPQNNNPFQPEASSAEQATRRPSVAPQHDNLRQPNSASAEQAAMQRLERRLGEVERKLDMILEALKPQKP